MNYSQCPWPMLAVMPRHDPDTRTKKPAWPSRPDCHSPRFITPGPADQPSTTARQWKLMQHTGVMQIVGRSLLWVDLTTLHVLLQCTYSNSSNYCIYIRRYTIYYRYNIFSGFSCCKIFSLCSLQLVFAISNLWYLENKLSCFGSNLLIFFVLSAHFNG